MLYYNEKYTFNDFRYLVDNTFYSFACYKMMLVSALDTDFYTQICHYLGTRSDTSSHASVVAIAPSRYRIFLCAEIRKFPFVTDRESIIMYTLQHGLQCNEKSMRAFKKFVE